MDKRISVIIPTYNERDNLPLLLEKIHTALSKEKYEVLFVDDNSKDGTADLASSLSTKYPVRVIVRQNERGLASAVVHGFGCAISDVLAVMDADLQHPPEVLADMLRAMRAGADLVIASRYVSGGSCEGWGRSGGLSQKALYSSPIYCYHEPGISATPCPVFLC